MFGITSTESVMSKEVLDHRTIPLSQGFGGGHSGEQSGKTIVVGTQPGKPLLPPLWKVKRELIRLGLRANERLPFAYLLDTIRQHHHDRQAHEALRETSGSLPLGDRVAVFILFQPKGIAGSTYFTLEHLAQNGWSVVVVSNSPLTLSDRKKLSASSSHVIERPNFGYDFGAYREGWRWLDRQGYRPQRLILMNDSTWFPLRRGDDSLSRMEALDADLAGHVFKTEKTEDRGRDHIESHLLMLGPRALAHRGIRTFMHSYVMSNSKAATIRRGEKGISQAAIAAGLKVKALFGREEMLSLLAGLSDEQLLVALQKLALHNDAGRKVREIWLAAAAAGRPWRDDFLAWTFRELSNSRQHLVGATFIDPAISFGGMGYLKKHAEPRFQLARLAVLRGVQEERIEPLEPIVAEEVRETIRNWERPVDWSTNPTTAQEEPRL
jgi:hypothetical protein